MSSLKIEERITVEAAPARVWAFLLDPARVAACLPGAKLDGTEGDRTFLGTMKVKVGPVTMEFKGKATMSEVVESERRVTLTGTGNDKGGSGSVRMDMHSQIVALEGGGSEIVVVADVDLSGKLVRFGRGMMEGISKALFKQFAERVRAELVGGGEAEKTEEVKAEAPAGIEEGAGAEGARVEEAVTAEAPKVEETAKAEVPEKAEEPKAEPRVAATEAEEPAEAEAMTKAEAAPPKEAPVKAEKAAPRPVTVKKKAAPLAAPADSAPLDAGSLFWTVVWESIRGFFRRLFGRGQ